MENKYAFDLKQAAQVMGVSTPTMLKLARRRGFPAFKVGRRWVIPCDAFKAWLEKQAQNHTVIGAANNQCNDKTA